jgi:dihydroflavonol-4-reductase
VSTAVATFVTRRPPSIPLESVRMSRRRMFFDAGKAVRELGLPQTPVRAAFEDALAWFRERGYLERPRGKGKERVEWASR